MLCPREPREEWWRVILSLPRFTITPSFTSVDLKQNNTVRLVVRLGEYIFWFTNVSSSTAWRLQGVKWFAVTIFWNSNISHKKSKYKITDKCIYYTSDSLWKIWLVESIQSIHNSLWTWHDKCNICCRYYIYHVKFTSYCELIECCCRYYIYHVKFNVCLVTKPLGVFSSKTKWLNASLLFLRMNYVKNV